MTVCSRKTYSKNRRTFRAYWSLFKSRQTGLLLLTGVAGYVSVQSPIMTLRTITEMLVSMLLAISGCTVLNMIYDRDIDAKMERTCNRPLPSGKVSVSEALTLGISMSTLGIFWAFSLKLEYGFVILAGLFTNIMIYTVWLKRRSAWSIIFGGVAGGLPVLAGRVLASGTIDWIGIAFFLAVMLWIPTHIMTFNLRYQQDYQKAGIPTFPSVYGERNTHIIVAILSVAATFTMGISAYGLHITWGYLKILGALSLGLLFLAIIIILRPSIQNYFRLFKYASFYMLSSMLILIVAAI